MPEMFLHIFSFKCKATAKYFNKGYYEIQYQQNTTFRCVKGEI